MFFRLTNAFVTFQEFVNNTLHDIMDEYVMIYLDNILIFTNEGFN